MAATKKETIQIKPLSIQKVNIRIVGDTPLLVHSWDEKSKKMILDNQTRETKTKAKQPKDPFDDFVKSLYWLTERPKSTEEDFAAAIKAGAKWGFPVSAIKQAGNSAAYRLGWVGNQMALRGTYFLRTEYGNMAEIEGSLPQMREDMVRVGQGKTDIRYRGVFEHWFMRFTLEYNASGDLSLEQIINVINAGGYAVGIGEWRPEKDGDFGTFHVALDEE